MQYNYTFDIAGIIIITFILIVHKFFYPVKTKYNQLYSSFGYWAIIVMIFDILSTTSITHAANRPIWLLYVLADCYYVCAICTAYSGKRYVFSRINWYSIFGKILDRSIIILYIILLFINHFTGWLFSFKNHIYKHGPIFSISYFVCFIYILHVLVIIVKYRKLYDKRIFALNITFIICNFLGAIIQMFLPYVLLSFFGTSVSFLVLLFSIETPDYQTLQKTLLSLEESKKAEEKAKKEAIEANKAKSNFLAEMSHEIRTPINTIMGLNEMVLRDSSEPQIIEYSSKIKNASSSLLETVNDILDLSKIESGKMELNIAEYSLIELIEPLVDMMKIRAQKKSLTFKLNINKKLPSGLIGDDIRIKQIILNLLTNAIKYTSEGFVELVLDGSTKNNKFVLHVEVNDTGIGIKKENIDKVLTAFERVDSQKNKGIEGTGLGLHIVQQLLVLMDSKIKISSTYGKGSSFSFDIVQAIWNKTPIGKIDENPVKKANSFYQASFIAPDAHILIVDDTEINLYVVKHLLQETEIQIETALSGPECLELVKQKHYDLIFLDHMMPLMDGIETLAHIKNEANLCKDVPIVALTANAISGSEEMYLSKGFSGYISKPINQNKIEEMISSLLPPEYIKEAPVRNRRQNKPDLNLPEVEGMDNAYAMTHFYSSEMFMDVLKNFYITLSQNISNIEQLVADINQLNKNEDYLKATIKNYQIAVHTMKSSSALVGMAQISGLSKLAETAAKNINIENINTLTPFLIQELKNMQQRLEFLFEDTTKKNEIDNNMLRAYLSLLEKAFHKVDIDKLDEIIATLSQNHFSPEIQKNIDALKIDVSNLDEKNGVEHINNINTFILQN